MARSTNIPPSMNPPLEIFLVNRDQIIEQLRRLAVR
jgi:hypothetical protein